MKGDGALKTREIDDQVDDIYAATTGQKGRERVLWLRINRSQRVN